MTPSSCNGTSCPILMERKNCTNEELVNCDMSPWSLWSDCSTDCGQGIAYRSRSLLTMAYCGGQKCHNMTLDETKVCNSDAAKQDCQVITKII